MALEPLDLKVAKEIFDKIIDINNDKTAKYSTKLAELRKLIEKVAIALDPHSETKPLADSTDFIFNNWSKNVDSLLVRKNRYDTNALRFFLNDFHHYKYYDYDKYESLDDKQKDFNMCVKLLSSSIIFFTNGKAIETPDIKNIYLYIDKINGQTYLASRNELLKKLSSIGDIFLKNIQELEKKIDQWIKSPNGANTIDGKQIEEIKEALKVKDDNNVLIQQLKDDINALASQKLTFENDLKNAKFELNTTQTDLTRWQSDYKSLEATKNNLTSENSALLERLKHKEVEKNTSQDEKANLSEQVKSKEQTIRSLEQDKSKLQTTKNLLATESEELKNNLKTINDSYQKLQFAIKQWRQWSLIACLLALSIGGGAGWFLKLPPPPCNNNNTIKSKVESLFSQIASGNEKAKQDLINLCKSPDTEVVQQISAVNIVKQGNVSDFTTKINANMKVAAVVTDSTDCKITRIFYIE